MRAFLAQTLEPLAKAGADLGVVIGYRLSGNEAKAIIEIYPASGRKLTSAATETGLASSAIPTLLIEGDNKSGLAYKIAQTIADAGSDLSFSSRKPLAKGIRRSLVSQVTLIKKGGHAYLYPLADFAVEFVFPHMQFLNVPLIAGVVCPNPVGLSRIFHRKSESLYATYSERVNGGTPCH